ncbi:hypothetical protein B566_EDAN012169 [Ephemera danica]|nr:hypothetical protein B566_EDAN012169 [Ephemera danica]
MVLIETQQPIEVSFIHLNDFHAKYEPISANTNLCKPGDNEKGLCYGGMARVVTILRELQMSEPNPVLLNAGDSYQGSLLYTLFKWNITLDFMNRIPFDATLKLRNDQGLYLKALGNHEFDDGINGVVPYFNGLKSPLVAVNIDSAKVPALKGKYKPSVDMANTGSLKFTDEVAPVSEEAARLRKQGVDIIVLLSHSGYETDQKIAKEVTDIDVIVGAHSHTLLWSGKPPSTEAAEGEYPTVVKQSSGRTVLIVQAFAFSKYVGVLRVKFDRAGEIVSWSGAPRILNSSIKEAVGGRGQRAGQEDAGRDLSAARLHHVLDWRVNLLTSQPFANSIDTIELKGKDVWNVLEATVTVPWPKTITEFTTGPGCMQVSGIQPTYDFSKPAGKRVTALLVRCVKCASKEMRPIELETWYTVAMPSFLSNGGGGMSIITKSGRNKTVGS